jgi:hypothetical protein
MVGQPPVAALHNGSLRRLVIPLGVEWQRPLRDVCCNPSGCGGESQPDAFLLPGNAAGRGDGSQAASSTTIFISSAARPRDDGSANVEMITAAIAALRDVSVGLNGSRCVVVFDGLSSKPSVTHRMRVRYASKIRRLRRAAPADVDVLVLEQWLHKANALRCAMERVMPRVCGRGSNSLCLLGCAWLPRELCEVSRLGRADAVRVRARG